MPEDSGGTISRDDVNRLVDLFGRYDGALNPLSDDSQNAEFQFNALIEQLHSEKVLPADPHISLSEFRSYARRLCRQIVSKRSPRYPCINPEIHPFEPTREQD